MFNQSKIWSKACTDYAVSKQSYVYRVYTLPFYPGLRTPSSGCTVYNEQDDSIKEVTQDVSRSWESKCLDH